MFRISARTILELGSELISSDIIAFYELIKNGFDACTTSGVEIRFNIVLRRTAYLSLSSRLNERAQLVEIREAALQALNPDAPADLLEKARALLLAARSRTQLTDALGDVYALSTIVVSDTGTGMSLQELADNFLVIGTASRKREVDKALLCGAAKSPFLGEKGIGRLSAMRLGGRLRVETARRTDRHYNILDIDWSAFSTLDSMVEDIPVAPSVGGPKPQGSWSGTRIIVGALSDEWTGARVRRMAEYDFARLTDPFLDQKVRPRIALYWNGVRQTIPWMNQQLIDHAHAHVSGTYEIVGGTPQLRYKIEVADLGFPHPHEFEEETVSQPDLVAALAGVSQEWPDSALVTVGPFAFEMHWYNRRRLGAIEGLGEMKVVRDLQERWSGILLFRDGFRVFPYGEEDDDWLALDRKALRRSGYTLNKTQFVGRVTISRTANPALLDQTNREGLREAPEQQVFLEVLQFVIQDRLFGVMKDVEKKYKGQRLDLSVAKTQVTQLQQRAKSALKRLRQLLPREGHAPLEELEQTLFEFSEFAEQARERIAQVEQESRQMVEMAGVGLMVEVVAHELARASENALENLEALKGSAVPAHVRERLASLRDQMKSLSKRVRVLDPLSVSGRQRAEVFSLNDLVRETIDAHSAQFQRHRIVVEHSEPQSPVRVRAVKGMVVQILENLISNSKYWLQVRSARVPSAIPRVKIAVLARPPSIVVEDNGPGIAPENAEKIFQPFFSLKEKAKRRGLGLYIARECAEHLGGSLLLEDKRDPSTGRLHRFTLELPDSSLIK